MARDKAKKNASDIRYHAKAYKRFAITFHVKAHADLIDYFAKAKEQGKSPTQVVIELVRKESE